MNEGRAVDEEVVGNEDVSRGKVVLKVERGVDKELSVTKVCSEWIVLF